ncbi:MAG: helix-turn-helix transcriptional regulator [Pseudomonas sp.]|nr:helix-turn-helix transcriptional regulator [Pseudomonas sp.]
MSHHNRLLPQRPTESVRRIEAGPWAVELLTAAAYSTHYVAAQSAIGFAFDSQRGLHAIGSDRVQPFAARPNSLAFVPAGCDVLSESPEGGEYLRLMRIDGTPLVGDRAFNNRIDRPAITLAQAMRGALMHARVDDDWEAWAHALAERANRSDIPAAPLQGSITNRRMRLLDEFIDAGLESTLTVKAMADLLGLSEGYFMRAFKQATGKSPHSYLVDRRLARARAMLLDSTARLSEIANSCGFSSQAHMTSAFRQRLGTSPAKLRRT